MRRTLFPPYNNPIARREISAYERGLPLWIRRCDTVGIVAVSLAMCLYLIVRWLHERPNARIWMIYQRMGMYTFDVMAYLQLTVGILYTCVLLRCIAAGISVAHRYRSYHRDDLVLTGIDDRQLLFGQWYAALYQIRGWMVALGLVRIAATLVMAAEYQFNVYWDHVWTLTTKGYSDWYSNVFDFAYHPSQFPLAFAFIIVLGLFEVWGTIGVGLLAGTWIRRGVYAAMIAIALRALPILIFPRFPMVPPFVDSYDVLVLRWYEYTWFAFVDGGTGAALRLTMPVYLPYDNGTVGQFIARSTLAFLAAVHMLLVYGVGAFIFSSMRWRQLGASCELEDHKPAFFGFIAVSRLYFENIRIIAVALGTCVIMCLAWRDGIHPPPDRGNSFYYNPGFLQWLQVVLWLAISATSLRMIHAGVFRSKQFSRDFPKTKSTSITATTFLHQGLNVFSKLRGWFLALGTLLITAFALVIVEHMMNSSAAHVHICNSYRTWVVQCFNPSEMWALSQWVLGLAFAIILSFIIPFSSICIGMASGVIFRPPLVALMAGITIRILPVVFNLGTPDIQTPDQSLGLLIPRWNHDAWMIFADSGVSALLGIAESGWHFGTDHGLAHIGFGLLAFTLVIYMLLGYIVLSLIAVMMKYRRTPAITAQLVADVQH